MRYIISIPVALVMTLAVSIPAAANHEHFLVTPGKCVDDIASGQTSLASGGGYHRFHMNVHVGTPGTFAMQQPNNPVQVYKVNDPNAPLADCP